MDTLSPGGSVTATLGNSTAAQVIVVVIVVDIPIMAAAP